MKKRSSIIINSIFIFLFPFILFSQVEQIDKERIISLLFEKYKASNILISYRFNREVTLGKKSALYKGKVAFIPFKEFEVNLLYPDMQTYKFDGQTISIFKNKRLIKREKIEFKDYSDYKSLHLLTLFFLYYLSPSELYKFIEKKDNTLVYEYRPNENYKEILYIDKNNYMPKYLVINLLDSSTKINFNNLKNINGYLIPTNIISTFCSMSLTNKLVENLKEEITISQIKIERR